MSDEHSVVPQTGEHLSTRGPRIEPHRTHRASDRESFEQLRDAMNEYANRVLDGVKIKA